MKACSTIAVIPVTAAVLAGCQKTDSVDRPPQVEAAEQSAAFAPSHAGIDWFEGSVDAAFVKARKEDKPVLLYWGAVWCPPCHELKAKVFSKPEFIAKSRLFVPVYLDGDDPGAQKWGETFLTNSGYPTVLVLRADRSEVVRLNGVTDLDRYAVVLDIALNELQPIENIIASVKSSAGPLSLDVCRRLAYVSHVSKDEASAGTGKDPSQGLNMQQAFEAAVRAAKDLLRDLDPQVIERCPPEARIERARLTAMHASAVMMTEGQDLEDALSGKKRASPRVKEAARVLLGLMEDREYARAVSDILRLDENVFEIAKRVGAMEEAELDALHRRWVEAREADADDPSLSTQERLQAFQRKLVRVKAQNPASPIPKELVDEAHRRIEAALASTPPSSPERVGVVDSVRWTLDKLGETDRSKAIFEKEIATAAAPYYYMSEIAQLEEKLGNKDAALQWFRRAYRESKGLATRFEWGVDYVSALIRLRPNDAAAIRDAVIEVLAELHGPDRLHGLTLVDLKALEADLRVWNSGSKHQQAIASIRASMDRICEQVPASEASSRKVCTEFLAQQKA